MLSFDNYVIRGVTKNAAGVPARKAVAVFDRYGYLPLIDYVLSDPVTGEYSVTCNHSGAHFVVCFDTTNDPIQTGSGDGTENAMVFDRVFPVNVGQ